MKELSSPPLELQRALEGANTILYGEVKQTNLGQKVPGHKVPGQKVTNLGNICLGYLLTGYQSNCMAQI